MPELKPLFVRLPTAQAEKLDRVSFESKTPKQQLITDLVSRYVGPTAEAPVGKHSFRPYEVLNIAQLADLLQIDEETALELAEAGDIPGRKLGDQWRFSRDAVLEWLGEGEQEPDDG